MILCYMKNLKLLLNRAKKFKQMLIYVVIKFRFKQNTVYINISMKYSNQSIEYGYDILIVFITNIVKLCMIRMYLDLRTYLCFTN